MFRIWMILLACGAIGCASPDDQGEPGAIEQVGTADMAEEPRKKLDLSMPEDFFADGVEMTGEPVPGRFDAAELFDRDAQESVNVRVMPRIEYAPGQGLPEVDGATVTAEKKTK